MPRLLRLGLTRRSWVRFAETMVFILAFGNLYYMLKDQGQWLRGVTHSEDRIGLNLPELEAMRNTPDQEQGPAVLSSVATSPVVTYQPKTYDVLDREVWIESKTLHPDRAKLRVVGAPRPNKGFLTIGIPSVKRPSGTVYLTLTLNSLIAATSPVERDGIVVVIFLCDTETENNDMMATQLRTQYSEYLATGFLQIVRVAGDFYPPLKGLKRNFNDADVRVTWRAKQVIDFSFMFLSARNISEYYIQIEDDVICAKHFVSSIQEFIKKSNENKKTEHWALLEFSTLGFIGKLVRSADLNKFAQFLQIFYEEQPVDWLMWYFRMSMGQREELVRKPTLFQHQGLKSSFKTKKDNGAVDKFFQDAPLAAIADNPPAKVFSTMVTFQNNFPQFAYSRPKEKNIFWAKFPQAGDSVTVVFDAPQFLEMVVVETGNKAHPKDILLDGTLQTGATLVSTNRTSATCENFQSIAEFAKGSALASNLTSVHDSPIACLRILVNKRQPDWIIFKAINVQVRGKSKEIQTSTDTANRMTTSVSRSKSRHHIGHLKMDV